MAIHGITDFINSISHYLYDDMFSEHRDIVFCVWVAKNINDGRA